MKTERFRDVCNVRPRVPFMTRLESLRRCMSKTKKSELIERIVQMGIRDERLFDRLEIRFAPVRTVADLTCLIRNAIAVATLIDEKRINYNFWYDSGAYEIIGESLEELIRRGELELAMELSEELVPGAGDQISMSDEGTMLEDVEACLRPVIQAVADSSDLSSATRVAWYVSLIAADDSRSICRAELEVLTGLRDQAPPDEACD